MANGKSGSSKVIFIVLAVVLGILVLGVGGVGVMAALGIFGARKYISQAKTIEGRTEVTRLAMGITSCAATTAAEKGSVALPESAPPVPASLSDVSGKKYQSSPSEWSPPAYACAKFGITMPQYFQYEWVRTDATNGKAIARADLDGDGKAEVVFEMPVTCTTTCAMGTLTGPAGP
jgi:hypothetical protein